MLADCSWHRRPSSREYALAYAQQLAVPMQHAQSLLASIRSTPGDLSLTEPFLQHLYACLQDIVHRAGLAQRDHDLSCPAKDEAEDEDDLSDDSGGSVNSPRAPSNTHTLAMDSYGSLNGEPPSSSVNSSSKGSAGSRSAYVALRAGDHSACQADSDSAAGLEKKAAALTRMETAARRRPSCALRALQKSCSSRDEWLHTFCSIDVHAEAHTPHPLSSLEKVWVTVGRTDGGGGELLGGLGVY